MNNIGRNFGIALLFGFIYLNLLGCPLNQPLNVGDLSAVSGDLDAVVLRYNPDTLDMKPVEATLQNVTNLQTLRGENFEMNFASKISNISIISRTEFSLDITDKVPPELNFHKSGDRYIPSDYHTYLFASVYHHFESARSQYKQLFDLEGITCEACFKKRDIHIEPEDFTGQFSLIDNAAYITGLDFFMIFPQQDILLVNVGMNEPIVVHEVFHAIFEPLVDSFYVGTDFVVDPENITQEQKLSYFSHGLPLPVGVPIHRGADSDIVERVDIEFSLGGFTAGSYTVINILNEGLADYFAFIFTNDFDILFHSFGDIKVGATNLRDQRRLDKDHTFPPTDFISDFSSNQNIPCTSSSNLSTCTSLRLKYQYVVGTMIARSLVEIGESIGDHERVARVVIAYLANFNTVFTIATDINLADAIGRLIETQATAAGFKTEFCEHFLENFSAISSQINRFASCN